MHAHKLMTIDIIGGEGMSAVLYLPTGPYCLISIRYINWVEVLVNTINLPYKECSHITQLNILRGWKQLPQQILT